MHAPRVVGMCLMLLGLAAVAHAGSSINLSLDDCSLGSPSRSITNACDSNSGTGFTAVVSLVPPNVTIAKFEGVYAYLTVGADAASPPDWWRLGFGGCRESAVTMAPSTDVGTSCPSIWGNDPNVTMLIGSTFLWRHNYPVNPASDVYLVLAGILSQDLPLADRTFNDSQELSVFRISVSRAKSTGAGACTGCAQPACVVLCNVHLSSPTDGTPPDGVWVTYSRTGNSIQYNGAFAYCAGGAAPARNRTWGAVKSLYR